MNKLAIFIMIVAVVFTMGCKKLPEFTSGNGSGGNTPTAVTPEVSTLEATEITENQALLNGVISNYDDSYKYDIGFYWGTTEELTNFLAADDSGHGTFVAKFDGLTANTTYYYKAYAIVSGASSENAGYGEMKSFTTAGGGSQNYSALIVGRWCTTNGGHFEVYNEDGTGKMWNPADDVQEEEADTFDWSIQEGTNKLTQIVHFIGIGDIPQSCNIIELSETIFKYNNEGWRASYELTRVE